MKKMYYYETLCRRCGKLNDWQLTPNREQGEMARGIVNNHKIYSLKNPYDIRECMYCHKETKHERVSWYSIPYSE